MAASAKKNFYADRPRGSRAGVRYLIICGIVVVLDQVTKYLAVRHLGDGSIVRLFDGDLVWFVHVLNPGLAFGVTLIPPLALTVISFIAVCGLAVYLWVRPRLPRWQGGALALIMGGALGNFIDRLRFGQVVDFISVDFPDLIMGRWPVFNVADSAISIGVVMLIFLSLKSESAAVPTAGGILDQDADKRGC